MPTAASVPMQNEIRLLRRQNPELLEVQEPAPPPNKKLKRWQLSKQRRRNCDREGPGEGVEALGAAGPEPPEPEQQGGEPSLREHVTDGARSDILNFPIFHFKAEPAKPVEAKPKKVKKFKAEKNKAKGTDNIKKYFKTISADKKPS